jgi:hypothetical protein
MFVGQTAILQYIADYAVFQQQEAIQLAGEQGIEIVLEDDEG